MAEDDENTMPGGPSPDDKLYPLLIAVTPAPAERIRLAERLDGAGPLLFVADLDELRRLIAAPQRLPGTPSAPAAAPVTPAPAAARAAPARPAGADDPLVIDSARSTARCGDREIGLTRLEHDLLVCLTDQPVRAWSYRELHRSVWRDEARERKADVQSLVKRLRRKLAEVGTGITIDAVRGVGFRLTQHRPPEISGA